MAKKSDNMTADEMIQPMAGRPATKIEIEAMGAICNLQDELLEAKQIIGALLAALPAEAREKHPVLCGLAKDFLNN